jgi:PPM family protein phosphatase
VSGIDVQRIETASLSDVGRQRSSNQDCFGHAVDEAGGQLLIVADGMGGHAGGATASRLAVEAVERVFTTSRDAPDVMLRAALETANDTVHAQARADARLAGMGTTGVALVIRPDGTAWVANVGDSRAYRLRDGRLEQLTLDHSLVGELQRRGLLTEAEAQVHPRRNEVLRSLGVEPQVVVDVAPIELRPGDQYLLCSDGLSGVVSDPEIAEILAAAPPEEAARRLVEAANARGGPDNVTVQIARIPGDLPPARETLPERVRRAEAGERRGRVFGLVVALLVVAALLLLALSWVLFDEIGREAPARGGTHIGSAGAVGAAPVAPMPARRG